MTSRTRGNDLLAEFARHYLHQDADLDHGNFWGALKYYLGEAKIDGKDRELFLIALLRLLCRPVDELARELITMGAEFVDPTLSNESWLTALQVFEDT